MRHTRWLIPYFQVWHAPHLLAHPSLAGCGATTPIFMHLFYRVCYCHPQICQGAPSNLSPIYCQMVFNFIVYLYKRPKLLTWRWIQDKFYKSKSSSCFPNFDASNAWQMGHNSRQGYFHGQELLSDFAAWIDLTSNADNSLISASCVQSYRTHFASLKRVDYLRVYQGFMMPFNHQAGYKVLKNNG